MKAEFLRIAATTPVSRHRNARHVRKLVRSSDRIIASRTNGALFAPTGFL